MEIIICCLITDYLLTYIGIRQNLITEANPLMGWLFNLPFSQGLAVRVAMSAAVVAPLYYIKKHYKHYKRVIAFILAIYAVVMGTHYLWIRKL